MRINIVESKQKIKLGRIREYEYIFIVERYARVDRLLWRNWLKYGERRYLMEGLTPKLNEWTLL